MTGVRGGSGVVGGLAVLAGCALLAGCGGSPAPKAQASGTPFSNRVCGSARQAAAKAFGSPLSERIVSSPAASLECVLTGHQVQVIINSQAGPRAFTAFDTETSHQSQVYGNAGVGVHSAAQQPVQVTIRGSTVAVWIPAQLMVIATDSAPTGESNGAPPGAGAYVTVAVSGRAAPANVALRVAEAAAGGTFAAHPDGPA